MMCRWPAAYGSRVSKPLLGLGRGLVMVVDKSGWTALLRPHTRCAVTAFQAAHELVPDGLAEAADAFSAAQAQRLLPNLIMPSVIVV